MRCGLETVVILETEDPVFCYKHPPLDSANPMLVCDRKKGHKGLHSWELPMLLAHMHDIRNGSPNAFYAAFDRLLRLRDRADM